MKRNLKKSKALKATLKNVKGKKVMGTDNEYLYENGVLLNKNTGYARLGSTSGNTPYNHVTIIQYGKNRTVEMQRLMGETFFNANWKVNKNKQMNHKDCNPNNNNRSNLELISRQDNIKHAIDNGVRFGRLTNDEVYKIREYYPSYKNHKVALKNIAKRLNVSTEVIFNVVNRITYRNV